jgi:kynureninase
VTTIAEKHGAQLMFTSPPAGMAHGLEVALYFTQAAAAAHALHDSGSA